jgi:hypothetical protein
MNEVGCGIEILFYYKKKNLMGAKQQQERRSRRRSTVGRDKQKCGRETKNVEKQLLFFSRSLYSNQRKKTAIGLSS